MTQSEKDTVVKQIHVHDTFTDHSIRAFGNKTKQNKPETQNKTVLHIPYSIILCKTILLCLSSFMFSDFCLHWVYQVQKHMLYDIASLKFV